MQVLAVAEIAGMGFGEKQIDQLFAADRIGKRKSARLVDPHQRCMDDEAAVHAERERNLHRLDRVVAAVRIAGEICLAHAGDEMFNAAPVGESCGEAEKYEIAAGHERRRQARRGDFDRNLACERGL